MGSPRNSFTNRPYGLFYHCYVHHLAYVVFITSVASSSSILFKTILKSGYFQVSWSKGIITAICKSGDKSDPSNYRGIFVSSFLSKLSAELFCRHPESVKDYTVLYKNATCYILSGLDFSQDFVLVIISFHFAPLLIRM